MGFSTKERFENLKCCVIIPTFNNCQSLENVIVGVLKQTSHLIVVNDGSTDETANILKKFPEIYLIDFEKNKGKGKALKVGFKRAISLGFKHAITIDSDGQHNPEEIPLFLDEIEKDQGAIIIGTRDLSLENIPQNSGFANRLSNWCFNFFTDISLTDTQSGYRAYPLDVMKRIRFISGKYEFELEVLVRAAWKKASLRTIPINVYYPPKEERITHFRPFKDFLRISILNSIFFTWTILYIMPFRLLRKINKKNFSEFIKDNFTKSKDSNIKIVISVSFGIFMGIVPIWGYQLITAIALAYLFRLNKPIVIVAANVSITPILPLILYLSYLTGGLVLGKTSVRITSLAGASFHSIKNNLFQYIVGSFVFAFALSIATGLIVFFLLKIFRKKTGMVN